MIVFIDDSGDPGFKLDKGSSKVFVICLVIFDDDLEAEKTSLAIKELRRKLKVSDFYEFKFCKTNERFKTEFFEAVRKYKFRARAIMVKKERIQSLWLKNHIENFYNYFVMQVLRNNDGSIKKAKLKFDSRGERVLRDELRTYLSRELDNGHKRIFSDLKFVDSQQNTLIQLADMVAGSISAFYTESRYKCFLKLLKESKRIDDIWEFK